MRRPSTLAALALIAPLALALAGGPPDARAQNAAPAGSTAGSASPGAQPGVTPAPVTAAPNGTGAVDSNEYRIGPEDVLQISIWKNEAMSRTVPVRPDGKVTLPLLNDVEAAGLTPMEFRDALIRKLAEYMPAPEVSVIVIDPRSFKVSVMGEVPKPGRYELRSRATVLDVLALAGGLSQFASRAKIVVLRPDGRGAMKRLSFNYNRAVSDGGEKENFYLQSGDIVVVP